MNKTKIVKFAASGVVGAGTSHVIDGIVKSNVDFDGLNSFGKFTVVAARITLGFMAGEKTREYTDAKIDAFVANWQTAKSDAQTPIKD